MSKTIREYSPDLPHFPEARLMSITATIQGEWGAGVQFTIGDNYIVLAENQVIDLIDILKKRLNREEGFRATEWGSGDMVFAEKLKEVKDGQDN